MRALYHFRTRGTGAEAVHISGIARALKRLGFSVRFSNPGNVNPIQSAGSNPFRNHSDARSIFDRLRKMPDFLFEILEILYNVSAYFKHRRMLKNDDFDLVYERHAFFLFSTAWLLRNASTRYVVEVNELVGDDRVRSQPSLAFMARWADRQVFRRADLIIVVSSHLKQRIVELGVDEQRVVVQPNAVDEEDYREIADGRTVRSQLGLDDEIVLFGFVGWFVPWHRLDGLLESFSRCLAAHPDCRLMLVGDGDLKRQLQDQATALNIADKVLWPGAVPHGDIPRHIAAMDVGIIPQSNAYRSPIKLFEYMGQARPVVAPDLEPIRQVVDHGQEGLLFPNGDSEALADTLSQLAKDPEGRQRMGRAARTRVLDQHTWTHNAREFVRLAGLGATEPKP